MARIGRGRARGGRILDISDLRGPLSGLGRGRITMARGVSKPDIGQNEKSAIGNNLNGFPENKTIETTEDINCFKNSEESDLEKQLKELENSSEITFIHVTLDYFSSHNDVQYYVDKVMDSLLNSSGLVQRFTMSLKLIAHLKEHGEEIKLTVFRKLQNLFKEMLPLMKEPESVCGEWRERARRFVDLLGQLFFRFRPQLGSPERYGVLAAPLAECLPLLVRSHRLSDLIVLVRQIQLNASSLNEYAERLAELEVEVRSALVEVEGGEGEGDEGWRLRGWLLCALDCLRPEPLPPHLTRLYTQRLAVDWQLLGTASPVQMLVGVPADIIERHFDVGAADYNKHRFVSL